MSCWQIDIVVQESLVFSERASTVGGHHSLNYIPGSALLGACAAQIYNELGEKAFTVFHSGKIRFGNAYPVSSAGETAYPMPFAWHYSKGDSITSQIDFENKVSNYSHHSPKPLESHRQAKQMREGYISSALNYIKPRLEMCMKTAIDPDTARAATGQLYGYEAISPSPDITYRASLSISIDNADLQHKITDIFNNKILYLGRSRSAQYGKVKVSIREAQNSDKITKKTPHNTAVIWLLSDLALADTDNKINLPHLSDEKINWSKSFLRYRRYSPYNGYRRSYDLERNVIEKGSVLVYDLETALSDEKIKELESGVGSYQESGLGQIVVNPEILSTDKPVTTAQVSNNIQTDPQETVAKPDDPFVHWLVQSSALKKQEAADSEYAETALKEIKQLYLTAHDYAAAQEGILIGPSSSQWGKVVGLGKNYQSNLTLSNEFHIKLAQVFNDESDKDCWGATVYINQTKTTFAAWLEGKLKSNEVHNPAVVAIHIARQTRAVAQQQERSS